MSEGCFTPEVYALYVIGSLDGDELREFTRHIGQGCDICRHELVQARELWTSFAASTPSVTPPPEVKQRILAAARRSQVVAMPPRRFAGKAWWQQAAAAVAILALGLGVGWNLHRPAPVAPPRVAEV